MFCEKESLLCFVPDRHTDTQPPTHEFWWERESAREREREKKRGVVVEGGSKGERGGGKGGAGRGRGGGLTIGTLILVNDSGQRRCRHLSSVCTCV